MALLLAVVLSTVADAGQPLPDAGSCAYEASKPDSWCLAAKATREAPLRRALVAELSRADGGPGEAALTEAEAEALFDDPRAALVYGEKTVSIVAPSMQRRHRQEHLDLMKLFLAPERVQAGASFAREREARLAATEARTGVDREVIVGILMWESKLGTITGEWRAFNVFTSQLFFLDDANAVALSRAEEAKGVDRAAQAKRVESIRARARKNLVALVRQCKARGIDPLEVKGSWAGALGFPQFMPASLQWADDGNGDGRIDLFDMDDAIASIGTYLRAHGYAASPRQAVWGYNHEDAYVQGVLAFAEALRPFTRPDAGAAMPPGAPPPARASP